MTNNFPSCRVLPPDGTEMAISEYFERLDRGSVILKRGGDETEPGRYVDLNEEHPDQTETDARVALELGFALIQHNHYPPELMDTNQEWCTHYYRLVPQEDEHGERV